MNNVEQQYYKEIIEQSSELLKKLHNRTLFVTGATGFIGSSFIKTLLFYNSTHNANVKLVALVRNRQKAERIFAQLSSNNLTLIIGSVEEIPDITQSIDHIVHGASVTSSFDFVEKPVDTINTALVGTKNILELAHSKQVKSMIYLSSMEVYGITDREMGKVSESNYGYIDILQVRNSYPVSKQMAESMCAAYTAQYNTPISIARLTQTIGPGIEYNDTRVAAYFARSVIEKRDIVLNTNGTTIRNIIYIGDAISALLTLLIKGEKGCAYNIAHSKEIMSIAETAKMIASKIAEDKIDVIFDIKDMPEYETNKELYLNLDTTELEKLGWKSFVSMEEAYRRMIKGIKQ